MGVFDYIKSMREYEKFTRAISALDAQIKAFRFLLEQNPSGSYDDLKEFYYIMVYFARNSIIERMNRYDWALNAKVIIPSMGNQFVILSDALDRTIGKLVLLAIMLEEEEMHDEIMDKGRAFYQVEELVPKELLF